MPSTETVTGESIELPAELTLADAIALAIELHKQEQLEAAELLYKRVLETDPQNADVLGFLAVLSLRRNRISEAIEQMEHALELAPSATRYNNFGNILLAGERVDDALDAYRKAIALEPEHADAYNNLGIIYRAQRRYDQSASAYERALELDPAHIEAHRNYGNLHAAKGDMPEAIRCFSRALKLYPKNALARDDRARAFAALGELDTAAEIYREWLEEEPDHPGVRHLLAACSRENVPERAPDAYIEHTFDSFSRSFDARLARLDYRAPELVSNALVNAIGDPARPPIALDAGCGTGLCGPLIAAHVSHLTGVDLSAGMLEKAQARGVYDELVKAELTQYLSSRHEAFDVVLSADTLVYFGALEDVLRAAAQALRPHGLLVFTVEAAEDGEAPAGHRLNYHGRYSHTGGYVERTLASAGLAPVSLERAVLRLERRQPVQGLVVTARKPG